MAYPNRSKTLAVAFDLETVPHERALALDPLTDYEFDEEELAREFGEKGLFVAEWLAALTKAVQGGAIPLKATGAWPALHPTTARIVQASFGAVDGASPEPLTKVELVDVAPTKPWDETGTEERDALERVVVRRALEVLSALWKDEKRRLLTFNGKSFDLPMLRWRAHLLNLAVPWLPWGKLTYRYADDLHVDLRLEFSTYDARAKGTLQHWADAFGVHAEEHGADVYGWVRDGDFDALDRYGRTEMQTLAELFARTYGAIV